MHNLLDLPATAAANLPAILSVGNNIAALSPTRTTAANAL